MEVWRLRERRIIALLAVIITITPAAATAQLVINPTRIQFDSPDHHAVLPTGDSAVDRYVLEVWLRNNEPGTGSPFAALDLGKPAVSTDSTTVSAETALFLLGLAVGSDFVATVRAIGPAGESRSAISNPFIHLHGPTPTEPPIVTDPANEIVIYASDVHPSNVHGRWALVEDHSAAGGVALHNANLGEAKPAAALASPSNYVEFTFTAAAGVPYRFWMRMRPLSNSYNNDSVFIQFTDSVNAENQPRYRLGTTDAGHVILEDGHGAGVSGWGWNDHGWGVIADPIYFATDGPKVLRIQQREDGVFFDQIVLSAGRFYSRAPGTLKNDATIVAR